MTSSQHLIEPEGILADEPKPPGAARFERPQFLRTIVELADPMQSPIVKGWLESELRSPK
ncbi:MAG: hypothetical protein ABI150_03625 [Nitrobacter sp.]